MEVRILKGLRVCFVEVRILRAKTARRRRVVKELGIDGEKDAGSVRAGGVPPPVFCKRVRNALIANGLGKHSFLKSAEEHENRGVNFLRFVTKSEKSEGAEIGEPRLAAIMRNYSTIVTDCQ